jgi:hypothetical protein
MAKATGLRIALGGLLAAALLEAAILLRGAARARVRLSEEGEEGEGDGDRAARGMATARVWTVVVTVLVALLGFALLAAFLFRVS